MPTYRVCGLVLESTVALRELSALRRSPAPPDLTFQLSPPGRGNGRSVVWLHHRNHLDGTPWVSIALRQEGYLLRFPDTADFLVSDGASRITCEPRSGVPASTIQHLLLESVLPLAISQSGKLVLHASSVVTSRGAVLFLGPSGRGKSTIAAAMALRGFPVVSDDYVLLDLEADPLQCIPSYPGLRLWPDVIAELRPLGSARARVAPDSEKLRLAAPAIEARHARPVPLSRVYVLAAPDDEETGAPVSIARMTRRDAVWSLVEAAYRLDATSAFAAREFMRVSEVVSRVPVHLLSFPRDLAALPLVHDAVVHHLRE